MKNSYEGAGGCSPWVSLGGEELLDQGPQRIGLGEARDLVAQLEVSRMSWTLDENPSK